MKHALRSIALILPIFLACVSYAQETASELYDFGKIYEERGEFDKALENYLAAKEKKNSIRAVNYKIMALEMALGERREEPLDQLLEFRETDGRKDELYLYYLGKAYDYRYEFQKASESYESLLNVD